MYKLVNMLFLSVVLVKFPAVALVLTRTCFYSVFTRPVELNGGLEGRGTLCYESDCLLS